MVQYWADLIRSMAGYMLLWVPIVQWGLWRIDKRWVAIPIALLLFVHAWPWIIFGYELRVGQSVPLERWQVAFFATEGAPYLLRSSLIATSLAAFIVWMIVSRFPGKNFRGEKVRPLPVGRVYVLMLIVVYVASIPLTHYKSLQYAVETDDLELARRRLAFNLAGLGPNNGKVHYFGSYGLIRSPLLPVAVENNSKKMVELLLKYGAEVNSEAPGEGSEHAERVVFRNPLAVAIQGDSMDMLGFLIDKGADPTVGVFPAVIEEKPEALRYLLERGADVEAARKELEAVEKGQLLHKMLEELKSPPG